MADALPEYQPTIAPLTKSDVKTELKNAKNVTVAGALDALGFLHDKVESKAAGINQAVLTITPASKEQVAEVSTSLSSLQRQVAGLAQACPNTAVSLLFENTFAALVQGSVTDLLGVLMHSPQGVDTPGIYSES